MTAEPPTPFDAATVPRKPLDEALKAHGSAAMDALCGTAAEWLAGRAAKADAGPGADRDPEPGPARRPEHRAALDAQPLPTTGLFANVDTEIVAWLACVQNMEPFLHGVVANRAGGDPTIPPRLRERWRHTYFENAAINMSVLETLAELADACERASVPVVVLKGLVTANRAFGDVALRMISDIDVLCNRKDCAEVAALARNLGFIGGTITSNIHTQLLHQTMPTSLEIHFGGYDFFPDQSRFVERALQEREWISVESVMLPALPDPLHAAFDLAHLIHHDFTASLQRWVEVATEIRLLTETRDWPILLTEVRNMGIEPELAAAWSVMVNLFGPSMGERGASPELGGERTDPNLPNAARVAMLGIEGGFTEQPLAEATSRSGSLASARFVARLLLPGRSATVAAYGDETGFFLATLRHLRTTLQRGWKKLLRVRRTPGGQPSSLGVKRRVYARRARVSGEPNPSEPETG